jgi:predicted nucleic acid-binding protein
VNYIDTNVIISFLNNREFNHEKALKALENFADMITLPLALLELKSVLFRTTDLCADEIVAFADYLSEINIKIPEADRDKVASYASELAINIRMRTLDVLNPPAAEILGADTFGTFDREFLNKENVSIKNWPFFTVPLYPIKILFYHIVGVLISIRKIINNPV